MSANPISLPCIDCWKKRWRRDYPGARLKGAGGAFFTIRADLSLEKREPYRQDRHPVKQKREQQLPFSFVPVVPEFAPRGSVGALATAETETGETEAEKRKHAWFRYG